MITVVIAINKKFPNTNKKKQIKTDMFINEKSINILKH